MKRALYFFPLFISLFLLITACIREDGDWDDNIKLSIKTVEFESKADSVIITTKGNWWWVCDITVNDNHFYGFEINPESSNYKIQHDCFIVERRDKNTLFIRLDENPLNVNRIVSVGLQAGDYFDRVTITQRAKQ
jgi:hypothetical protein